MPRQGIDHRGQGPVGKNAGAREIEQQRRVLVGARIEAGQRRHEIAATEVRIAGEIERGIGGQKSVAAEGPQQVRGATADDAVDVGGR